LIEKGEKHSSFVFQILKNRINKSGSGNIKVVDISNKTDCWSYQVADLIAYEGYKNAVNQLTIRKMPERSSFTIIKEGNLLSPYLHNSVSARNWIKRTHNVLIPMFKNKNAAGRVV
jgi:hypothetical protein